jgi:hypothetical protein
MGIAGQGIQELKSDGLGTHGLCPGALRPRFRERNNAEAISKETICKLKRNTSRPLPKFPGPCTVLH